MSTYALDNAAVSLLQCFCYMCLASDLFTIKLTLVCFCMCAYAASIASLFTQYMAGSYAGSSSAQQNMTVPVLTLERMQTLLQLPLNITFDSAALDLLARMLTVNPNDRISVRYVHTASISHGDVKYVEYI